MRSTRANRGWTRSGKEIAQHRIDVSPVSYHKNSIAQGCPHLATAAEGGFRHYAERVDGEKIRARSASFQDHFSQATGVQAEQPRSPATRRVAVLAADGVDGAATGNLIELLTAAGVVAEVLAPRGGTLDGGLAVDRGLLTMASVLYDAVLVAPGRESVRSLRGNGAAIRYVAEAFKHGKPVGAIGDGIELLREVHGRERWQRR